MRARWILICMVTAMAAFASPLHADDSGLLLKATSAEMAGDYDRALQIYRHLARTTGSALRDVDAARVCWTLNRPVEAKAALTEALARNGKCSEALSLLARVELSEGKADEAKAHLEAAVATDAGNAEGQRLLADLLAHDGMLDEAYPHFDRLLAIDPGSVHARQNVVAYLASHGKLDEAIKVCRAGLKESTGERAKRLRMELGHLYLQAGKVAEANEAFKNGRDPESADSEPYQMLATTCSARADWVSALSYAKTFCDIETDSSNSTALSAWCAYQAFDLLEAKNILERAVTQTPNDPTLRNLYAIVLIDLRRWPNAAEQLLDAEKLDEGDLCAKMNTAMMQLLSGKKTDGLETATTIVAEFPKIAAAKSLLAYAKLLNDQRAEAAKLAEQALKEEPGDVMAHVVCARVLIGDKCYEEALAHLKDAASTAGGASSFIQSEIANVWIAKGDAPKAASAAQFALQLSASNPEAKKALARAMAMQGNWDGALLYLRELSARSPKDLAAKLELGNALVNKGDFVQAQLVYEAAQKLAPDSSAVLTGLSRLAEKQGNKRLARKFERMIGHDKNGPHH